MQLKSSATSSLAGCFAALILLVSCGGSSTPPPPPPVLTITTATLPDWMATFAYTQALQATGGVSPFGWSVSSGKPTAWLDAGKQFVRVRDHYWNTGCCSDHYIHHRGDRRKESNRDSVIFHPDQQPGITPTRAGSRAGCTRHNRNSGLERSERFSLATLVLAKLRASEKAILGLPILHPSEKIKAYLEDKLVTKGVNLLLSSEFGSAPSSLNCWTINNLASRTG